MSAAAPAIVVDRVSKQFRLPHERVHTLKERALHPLRRTTYDRLVALRNVSFDIQRGEFFGIVGRNGSGKSTLLKCLAGIYGVDHGEIWINGRMSTFIELGVGFNPDLPARDNVMINGTMLGLSAKESRRRFDSIIDFAELHEFLDLKLKNYSSGMMVRLAFSVAIQVDADILLIDEVLAVGDAAFQQKCFDEFHRLRDESRTIVLVTHDMGSVQRFCHRAMLLERGDVVDIADPERIGAEYLEMNFPGHTSAPAAAGEEGERHGDRKASIVDCWLESTTGEQLADRVAHGQEVVLKAVVEFQAEMIHPAVSVSVESEDRRVVFVANTAWLNEHTGVYRPGDRATATLRFRNLLAAGRYHITPAISKRGTGLEIADQRVRFRSFVSTATVNTGGVVDLDFDMELTADAPAGTVASEASSA